MATLKDYALTNLADVKESLNIASSVTRYDNLIIRKINQATAMIENYCGRRFKATNYTDELYTGNGTDQIVLKQRPIITLTSLKGRDTSLNENDFETIDSSYYFADDNAGILGLTFRSLGHWGRWAVTYRAGYETIPDDLAEACASLAAYLVTNADGGSVGVSSKKEGQRQISYAGASVSFARIAENLGIDEVLNTYANTALFADK